jgi:putative peptidoglycan lipid II flippase
VTGYGSGVYRSGDDPRIAHPVDEIDQVDQHGHAANADHIDPGAAPEPVREAPGLYRSRLADPDMTGFLAPIGGGPADAEASIGMPPVGPAAAGETAEEDQGHAGLFRNSAVMAGFNLLSRLLGYGRTVAIGATLGEVVGNAYTAAVYSPQMIYELLLGGTLTSVVVPLLVRARKTDPDRGEAFTQRFATLAALALLGTAVLAVLCAPLIAHVVAPPSYRSLVANFSYVMLPAIFFMGLSALFQAVLNTRGSFAAPTWAPILNNVVIIAFFTLFHLLWQAQPSVASMSPVRVAVLGIGFTGAIFVQVLALWPALRRVGFRWRFRFDFRQLGLRRIGRLGAWAMCYVVISQIGLVVVISIAGQAAGHHGPGQIVYDYAYLLMMMVNGIAAVSVMTALMPRMSAAAADHRWSDVAANLSLGTRLSSVLLVPGTAALVVLGSQMAVVLFNWGHFDHAAALSAGPAIALAGFGLVPFAVSQMQIFAFYALPDTRTPALINIPVVVVKVLFDLVVLWLSPTAYVVALLLLGNAVSFVVAAGVSYGLLRRRIGSLGLRRVVSALLRMVGAAAAAGLVAWLVSRLLIAALGQGKVASLAELASAGAVLLVCYFGAAYLLKVREVSEVVGMVRRRLGR